VLRDLRLPCGDVIGKCRLLGPGMSRAELEKRILRLHKGGTGILKIGKVLGIGTGTVQRVVMEQLRPFGVDAAEAVAPSPHDTTGAP
jgi:hypothetical protein